MQKLAIPFSSANKYTFRSLPAFCDIFQVTASCLGEAEEGREREREIGSERGRERDMNEGIFSRLNHAQVIVFSRIVSL